MPTQNRQTHENGFVAYAPLAQSVERRTVNPQVVGSSPTGGAKKDTVASATVSFLLQATGGLEPIAVEVSGGHLQA